MTFNLNIFCQYEYNKIFCVLFDSNFVCLATKPKSTSAYENMSEQQRRESHMTFGLAICSHAMGDSGDNGMLFIAANQINRGGQEMITCVQQKTTIAALNLKVGKKSMELTDSASALAYFENGISFLNAGHWDHQYELSIGLFDAAADAACELNDAASVHFFTECVLENAKNLYDKLNAMYVNVRFLRMARALPEVRKFALLVLEQLGEI